ncbi:MAG TPA: GtrA family protein [Devosiaceae bacterium]|nr:GtrA family protein [Devosiaceae bacterium]
MFVRYLLFAVLGTLCNLGTQELTVRMLPLAPLILSIAAGTVVGFVLKYLLDKVLVFGDGYGRHRDELGKIGLYGAFSVLTTLIFWVFELSFWEMWHTDVAKYCGGVIGLAIGYSAKFLLDRTFVFKVRGL